MCAFNKKNPEKRKKPLPRMDARSLFPHHAATADIGSHDTGPHRLPFSSVCAPMVRYSKLPFRLLCLENGTDLVYTPMMLADSFSQSRHARDTDFQTHPSETDRLVVQFAANDPVHFGKSARLVKGHCAAVNLNCGCPQRWAREEGIGSALMDKPHLVADCIRQARNQSEGTEMMVSVKIRLIEEEKTVAKRDGYFRKSVDFARQMEAAGAHWVDVHGRTWNMRSGSTDVKWEATREIKRALSVPVVHNGDVMSLQDAIQFHELTEVDGIMSARGLLKNPALFATEKVNVNHQWKQQQCCTPHTLYRFLDISTCFGSAVLPLQLLRNHMCFMLHDMVSRKELVEFSNTATSVAAMVDWMTDRGLLLQKDSIQENVSIGAGL